MFAVFKKSVLIFICGILVIVSAVIYSRVFSYNDTITHPFLTEQISSVFNKNSDFELTNQEINWLRQGSVEEDTPIRWMNHFYNPLTDNGLWGFSSAKDWSRENIKQLLYPKGNQTWQKAIDSYIKGNKEKAFIALGHILHLIEDMSVPSHTRLDAHPEGDPYESWAKDNGEKDFNNIETVEFNTLDEYFDFLAQYSNKYFLSKDTIDKNELLKKERFFKKINENETIECVKGNIENKDFCLIVVRKDDYFLDVSFVHSDYYSLLAPKTISYGAGVIELFFEEVEKEKQKQQEKSLLEKLKENILGVFQPAAPVIVLAPENNNVELPMSNNDEFGYPIAEENPRPSPAVSPTPQVSQSGTTGQVGLISQPMPSPQQLTQTIRHSVSNSFNGPPYPGFGGGGGGAQTPSVSLSTPGVEESESTPTSAPTPTLEETPTPSPEPPPTPTPESSPLLESSDEDQMGQIEPSPSPEPTPTPTPTPLSEPQPLDVVINEIAWSGTSKNTSSDEWIELYNNTDREINFGGAEWILYSQTDNTPYINLSGIIPARGFYLLERTNDSTIADILADQIYTGDLNNGGEILALSYASTTIDKTAMCGSGSYKWCPAGDYRYRSMERMDYDNAGTEQSNWWYNNEFIRNGTASNGNFVYGTPKSRNSANYLMADANTSVVNHDITLKKSKSPYFLNNHTLNFQSGAVFTIEPGVIIKFWEAGLNFLDGAKIISQGTADEPVVFTAFYDDKYGGDINNDADASKPTPGSWPGISIGSTAGDGSVFSHSIIRYAGSSANPIDKRANLVVEGVPVEIKDSVFEYSGICGLKISESDSEISGNIFRNNNNGAEGTDAGLWIREGSPIARNNTFIQNGRGIYLDNALALIEKNIFESNSGEAIYSNGVLGNFSGNSGSDNFINGIVVLGNITANEATTTLSANPLPYVIKRFNASVIANSALIISKGIVIKSDKSLNVEGNLFVQGENSADIVLTSLYDDSISGDTNNDGSATENNYGLWQGVVLKPGSYSEIRGATFRYANTALTYQNSPINLSNIKFEGNNLAIKADAGSVSLTINAGTIEFIENIATTTPPLW